MTTVLPSDSVPCWRASQVVLPATEAVSPLPALLSFPPAAPAMKNHSRILVSLLLKLVLLTCLLTLKSKVVSVIEPVNVESFVLFHLSTCVLPPLLQPGGV